MKIQVSLYSVKNSKSDISNKLVFYIFTFTLTIDEEESNLPFYWLFLNHFLSSCIETLILGAHRGSFKKWKDF